MIGEWYRTREETHKSGRSREGRTGRSGEGRDGEGRVYSAAISQLGSRSLDRASPCGVVQPLLHYSPRRHMGLRRRATATLYFGEFVFAFDLRAIQVARFHCLSEDVKRTPRSASHS